MGYTIAEVANQAGHASERTTLIYTNTSREQMKEKANLL
jgi:integrase/recombinase XerD